MNKKLKIDDELFEKAKEVKNRFWRYNEDPRESPYIPVEVSESWIRSKDYNIDPNDTRLKHKLPAEEFKKLLEEKKLLIQTAIPLIKKYLSILNASGHRMTLTDRNGVLLYTTATGNDENDYWPELGTVLRENTIGTSAHELCMNLGQPLQFIGPYNYCVYLEDYIVSAAPIFEENAGIIGSLLIYQLMKDNDHNIMQTHSLGWVSAMAFAIEQQMMLLKANDTLKWNNKMLQATLSIVNGGVITLDKRGIISHINQEGAHILSFDKNKAKDKHISAYIHDASNILMTLKDGLSVNNHELILPKDNTERRYLTTVTPIMDDSNIAEGAVVHLVPIEGIKKLVNDFRGAQASYTFANLVGNSPVFLESIRNAKQFSNNYGNVLIQGESGAGKELFAQAIHNDYRPDGPFVSINCSAIPRNLIESELFGYEGGAFTGAERKGRPGLIELANDGTLFLDEIGDMPLEIQPVLLRVLEEKKVLRIGGQRYIPVNFRVIAATNQNLRTMVAEKTFREDLYYRLAVFKLRIPALRERKEDILELTDFFIKRVCRKIGINKNPDLSSAVKKTLLEYPWPGNVRQLENTMVYAVTMAQNGIINLRNLPDDILLPETVKVESADTLTMDDAERIAIEKAMIRAANSVATAADILGISKSTLYYKLRKYKIPSN
ncbi:sigma 54-interacting transcriptional regulator [Dehalobacter sp. DCM]|uniref:sigma-54 interaction domain-containing protein n=1 Tax=Dehalobacter sp. DCM TaxID=2907827 RepID=UPI0030821F28|nr:sigma 54-interacting transcriptional regulator [Dehalobacter sp. DCM]